MSRCLSDMCLTVTSALATDQRGPRAELATRCSLLVGSHLCDTFFMYPQKQMCVCVYLYIYIWQFLICSDDCILFIG